MLSLRYRAMSHAKIIFKIYCLEPSFLLQNAKLVQQVEEMAKAKV